MFWNWEAADLGDCPKKKPKKWLREGPKGRLGPRSKVSQVRAGAKNFLLAGSKWPVVPSLNHLWEYFISFSGTFPGPWLPKSGIIFVRIFSSSVSPCLWQVAMWSPDLTIQLQAKRSGIVLWRMLRDSWDWSDLRRHTEPLRSDPENMTYCYAEARKRVLCKRVLWESVKSP